MKINILVFAPLLLAGCISMNIDSQSDIATNFSNYKTYAWLRRDKDFKHADPNIDNDIIENRIIAYTNTELEARGYSVDTLSPDILLDFNIVTQQKTMQTQVPVYSTTYTRPYYYNPYNNNPYNNYNNAYSYYPAYNGPTTYISGYKTLNTPYEDGTVSIYILNRTTNKLIWKASAEGSVDDVSSFQWELPKDIHAMFKRYPVKPLKTKQLD